MLDFIFNAQTPVFKLLKTKPLKKIHTSAIKSKKKKGEKKRKKSSSKLWILGELEQSRDLVLVELERMYSGVDVLWAQSLLLPIKRYFY